jgi:hypothetical protein
VSDEVLDLVLRHSLGNQLSAFWLIYEAILGNFLQIKEHRLLPTTKFQNNINLDSWTNLQVPFFMFKKNQVILERSL